jgi:hypothetical protein
VKEEPPINPADLDHYPPGEPLQNGEAYGRTPSFAPSTLRSIGKTSL